MRRIIAIAVISLVFVFVINTTARATFVDHGNFTTFTSIGVDVFDVDAFAFMTFDEAIAAINDLEDGWHLATVDEVREIFNSVTEEQYVSTVRELITGIPAPLAPPGKFVTSGRVMFDSRKDTIAGFGDGVQIINPPAPPTFGYSFFAISSPSLIDQRSANVGAWVIRPTEPTLSQATIDLDPDVFEVEVEPDQGSDEPEEEFLRAFIEPPAGVSAGDIDASTVTLSINGTTLATVESPVIVDNVLDVLFRLDPTNVSIILGLEVTGVEVDDEAMEVEITSPPSEPIRLIQLTVSGELINGGIFSGTDAVRVMLGEGDDRDTDDDDDDDDDDGDD